MKIRVVREDGADLDFATGLRRTLAIWLPNQFPLLLALTGGQTTTLKVAILLTIIVAFVFQFFDYCSAFVDPNKQSFHDLIADTIVIDA